MTWISHKLITGSILFAATGDLIIASCGAIGAIIPDRIEGFPDSESETSKATWRRNHRQGSHYLPFYLAVFLITQAILHHQGVTEINAANIISLIHQDSFWPQITTYVVSFVSLGAAFHVLEDAICGTVPGMKTRNRWGTQLFRVGSANEYIGVFSISLFLVTLRIYLQAS